MDTPLQLRNIAGISEPLTMDESCVFCPQESIGSSSDKVTKYQKEFSDIKADLSSALAKDTNDKVNKIYDMLDTKKLLKPLKLQLSLGPKCWCLEQTWVKTIEILNSWIKDGHCDKQVLWCSGLAGTGKSSLAGTLHDKLTDSEGDRLWGQLGAFIHYDHTKKSPDMLIAHLIPSIAFLLGDHDERIGHAIAKVVHDSLGIWNTPAQKQYTKLLYEPLKSMSNLVKDGPLVIIIDSLDECRDLVISDSYSDSSDGVQQGSRDSSQLEVIRHESDNFSDVLVHYPDAAKDLASKATGLFIWADVACWYLATCKSEKALTQLLDTSDNAAGYSDNNNWEAAALKGLDGLYTTALNEAAEGNQSLKKCIMKVLGTIMVARTPLGLTRDDFKNLVLDPKDTSAQDILINLGSMVETDAKSGGSNQLIHKSFDDFLTHQSSHCKDSWFINIEDHKRKFAWQCLSVLTSFLKEWALGSDIPSHIQNYTLLGLLWHIKWFDKSDVKDLRVLFGDDLSAKWFKVAEKASQNEDLLDEIIEVLHWVDSMSCYCADVLSWSINDIGFLANPAEKLASLFFKSEESLPALKDHQYHVLGHLVVCQSMFVGDQSGDDNGACWEVIDSNGPRDQSASAFILSISDIQTSHYHHCLLKDLKHNVLLLYTTGIIIINIEAMFLMRIDINTTTCHEWKNIVVGDASHVESHPIYCVGKGNPLLVVSQDGSTLAHLSPSVNGLGDLWMLRYWDTTTGFLTHSSTLDICQQKPVSLVLSASGTRTPDNPYTAPIPDPGFLAKIAQVGRKKPCGISALLPNDGKVWCQKSRKLTSGRHYPGSCGTTSIIVTSEDWKTSLHIVPFDNGDAVHNVIDCVTFQVVASFLDERKIAYLMENAMVIRDIQAKNDVFHHRIPSDPHEPSNIMITLDGKSLITVHPGARVIRTWNIEALRLQLASTASKTV
ncbi:hypothetical protein ARMGADRAFT_1034473 [Armillaria gallica]|uniref:Nephrocystin 3-like N-terminal domain-containing protein n=1 Tax=Armillaria gallica TaxID=47427 RepID=A0A2H3CXX8_ARMGA|nr:hypothetical protein ARMGADRAFT_1034473 [Armillaria gallica]